MRDLKCGYTLVIKKDLKKNKLTGIYKYTICDNTVNEKFPEEGLNILKNYSYLMEYLEDSNTIYVKNNGILIKSMIGKEGKKNIFEDVTILNPIAKAEGYSFVETMENLNFSLEEKNRKKFKVYQILKRRY